MNWNKFYNAFIARIAWTIFQMTNPIYKMKYTVINKTSIIRIRVSRLKLVAKNPKKLKRNSTRLKAIGIE